MNKGNGVLVTRTYMITTLLMVIWIGYSNRTLRTMSGAEMLNLLSIKVLSTGTISLSQTGMRAKGGGGAVYLTPVMIYVPHTSNDYVGGIHVFNVHLTGFFLFLFFCIKHNQTGVYKKI